jgi:hypothetical protein
MGFGLAQWQRAQRAADLFGAPRAAPKACPARSGHGGLWCTATKRYKHRAGLLPATSYNST